MPTTGTRLLLTITSFAPLWLALGLLEYPGQGWWAVPMYALAALSPIGLYVYLRAIRRIATTKETVDSAVRREHEVVTYVATYLVPFAFISLDGWRPKTVVALFLLVILGLAVHGRIYFVNPLLAAAGYHLFEVQFEHGSGATLITRRSHMSDGVTASVRTLDHDVYVEA